MSDAAYAVPDWMELEELGDLLPLTGRSRSPSPPLLLGLDDVPLPALSVPDPPLPTPALLPDPTRRPRASAPAAPAAPVHAPGEALAAKRRVEAARFPRAALGSLAGTTSAEVRRMSGEERELVLYKRKLRNRESARRSRQKRQATLAELQDEVDDLACVGGRVLDVALALRKENDRLSAELNAITAERDALAAAATAVAVASPPAVLPVIPVIQPPLPDVVVAKVKDEPADLAKLGG